MSKIYDYKDGNFPPANTKVIVRDGGSASMTFKDGDEAYVAGYTPTSSQGLVVNKHAGQYHGHWIHTWELAEEVKPTVVGGLSDKKKRRLAEEATAAATKLGYCDEAQKVLKAMGLPVKEKKTFEVEVWPEDKVTIKVNGEKVETDPETDADW